jgi:23S rRNA pseudouridine1911/1915/1917 synthase
LPVIYQDDNVVVIDKPAGILSHSKGAMNDEFTVAEFLRPLTSYHSDPNRPGIIHRLDRDTSGVMIGVRNDQTASLLQRQFSDRKVKKTYYAVVDGVPKQDEAVIDLPIARHPTAPSTFRVNASGKSAQTTYKVLKSDGKRSLIELKPYTGRTHQLRVHMAYLGTPIHGDKVYGKQADRLYLHAASLEITIPKGDRKVFESPVPPEFERLGSDTDAN